MSNLRGVQTRRFARIRQRTIERPEGPARRWRSARPAVGLLLALAFVVGSCNELPSEPITFENQSDQTIEVVIITRTGESVYVEILPGSTVTDPSPCVDPDLEARLKSGAVVSARAGPFCQGDPVWVITQAEVDTAK